jgi:hypothetical protein
MIKKSLAAMVLFGTMAVPVVAQAVPQVNDDVQLTWSAGKVKVSWTESAAVANTITLQRAGAADKVLGTTAVGAANELLVDPAAIGSRSDPAATAKIVVSDAGTSAAFDTYLRPASSGDPSLSRGQLSWGFAPDTATDTTPNDPLDVAAPDTITPKLTLAGCQVKTLPGETDLSGVIPNQGQPYNLKLYVSNEWGQSVLDGRQVRTSSVTMTAPKSSTYGSATAISGKVTARQVLESGGTCVNADDPKLNRIQMSLQARNHSTDPWYSVNAGFTDAQGNYKFVVTNPGAREYRVWTGESGLDGTLQYGSVTASQQIRATTHVVEAKFISPTIMIGQQPNAYLRVEPAGSQRAALQFKNASGVWQGLMYKTLSSGRGLSGPFAFNRRGTTQFRWWVPASASSTGLTVDAVYSSVFTLTVR